MQVLDSNTRLLYGLFQSICGWALENGYRDISTMKNLLKLAMVDVCKRRYEDKPPTALQLSVVADLGISLRNAQYSYSAAVGLFANVINFALVYGTNLLSRRFTDYSLW